MRLVYWLIKLIGLISLSFISLASIAQGVQKNLHQAALRFELDSQMQHAIYSLYVVDGKTGKVVFNKNSQIGLAPASCQKLFTSGAAFELLGNDYRYKTELTYTDTISNGAIKGNLMIVGYGDPSLGSWRFRKEIENNIFNEWIKELQIRNISSVEGHLIVDDSRYSAQATPGGWIWEDIGNYYGAAARALNWHENQFDLVLHSGLIRGTKVDIVDVSPRFDSLSFINELTAAARGTGDNAYLYLPSSKDYKWVLDGTIPTGENNFIISGAIQDPSAFVAKEFLRKMDSVRIKISASEVIRKVNQEKLDYYLWSYRKILSTHYSLPFDTLNFWFLRKSINLYGEAFIKTIALEKSGFASTEKGVELVKDFWSQQGIDKAAINIVDGSGLSPQNRVTTNALVKVLQYAKTRPWYNSFYSSLPTFNGMKMKSGSIGGARSFAGYHTSKDGHEYIFAIIVNNYDGSSSEIVSKMYKILDNLK